MPSVHFPTTDSDRLFFEQTRVDAHIGRVRVPACLAICQGILPSLSELGAGPLEIGGCSLSVGDHAIHLMYLQEVTTPALRTWALQNFPRVFEGHDAGFVMFQFHSCGWSPISDVLAGFQSEPDLRTFVSKFEARFNQRVIP